jgi:hypothetical protein
MQRLAHEVPTFHVVRAKDVEFAFYYDGHETSLQSTRNIPKADWQKTYVGTAWEQEEVEYFGFSAEPKLYFTSSDMTKISIGSEKDRKWVEEWFKKNMAGVKPEPRFSLQQHIDTAQQTKKGHVERARAAAP